MSERFFAHLPWTHVDSCLEEILELGLQPEIAFSGPALDHLSTSQLEAVRQRLEGEGLQSTVHGPFHDLNPGALDPLVRDLTAFRVRQTLEAARALGSRLVVFHPGFEKWKYGLDYRPWLEQSLTFWPPLLKMAAERNIFIALENIFEETPDSLVRLVEGLDSPWVGYCFDVGHWNLFAGKGIRQWLQSFGPRLFHLHLHDNFGSKDAHLPVGSGRINFRELFSILEDLTLTPSKTFEAHDLKSLQGSIQGLRSIVSPVAEMPFS